MEKTLQRYAPVVGRVLLTFIFISSGLNKIGSWDETAAHMAAQGMPLVTLFLIGAIVLEVGGGLMVLLGWRARLGALALIVFLVPATAIFHNPMGLEGMEQQMQMIQMFKNIAIMGGLLLVLGLGAGPISLDNRRASS